jgi:hypothetical protein
MKRKFSSPGFVLFFALPALIVVNGCWSNNNSSQINQSGDLANKASPAAPDKTASPEKVLTGTNATPDEAMILSVRKDVSLKRQGAPEFVPILRNIAFRIGDTLQVGVDSTATVLCSERGICELVKGTYSSCCSAECKTQIQMLRMGTGPNTPVVKRSELTPDEVLKLNTAEAGIRKLELSPLATQFVLTRLHSGWKLEETNQELDTLTNQLKQPGAKEELKDLYLPVVRKTGDMQLKLNRLDKAKELYQLNISSQANDSFEKAASHEGLATVSKQSGDKEDAVRNFEMAKNIYLKQGNTKAATTTEKEIANTKLQRTDKTTLPKTKLRAQSPSP